MANPDRFWAKVLFKEFIRHFRKMTPEQITKDVIASMDDLEDLNSDGTSFGSMMVRWSFDRKEQYPEASNNGKKGGRPRKDWELPMPSKEELYAFAESSGIDEADAREWYEMTSERDGRDREGNRIRNWKKALPAFCKAKGERRP